MQKIILLIFTLIFPATVFAQEFRPLLDPTIACSYGSPDNPVDNRTNKTKLVDYYFIVEVMPGPEMSITKIENLLQNKVLFNEKELLEKGNLSLQCLVNCKGIAGDYQINECPSGLINVCCQILEVFKTDVTEWEAGKQRDANVDVLMKINLGVNDGKIKIISS